MAADEPKISATLTGPDQVKQFKGKRVTVILRSGKELDGTVGEVSSNNLELKQLVGKDMYDALIKIDDVAAYVYKAR